MGQPNSGEKESVRHSCAHHYEIVMIGKLNFQEKIGDARLGKGASFLHQRVTPRSERETELLRNLLCVSRQLGV